MVKFLQILGSLNGYKTYTFNAIRMILSILVLAKIIPVGDVVDLTEAAARGYDGAVIIGSQIVALVEIGRSIGGILARKALARQTATLLAAQKVETAKVRETVINSAPLSLQ